VYVNPPEKAREAAVGNLAYGHQVMRYLLEQLGANKPIMLDVVERAAGNESIQKEEMISPFDRLEADASTTTDTIRRREEDAIASSLHQRGADIPIVEELVKAAVHRSKEEARGKMEVLLERREQEVYEVLERLRNQREVGRYEVFSAQLTRVECGEG
jgi:hypothetical protein